MGPAGEGPGEASWRGAAATRQSARRCGAARSAALCGAARSARAPWPRSWPSQGSRPQLLFPLLLLCSLAQVHEAIDHDGKRLAVKVGACSCTQLQAAQHNVGGQLESLLRRRTESRRRLALTSPRLAARAAAGAAPRAARDECAGSCHNRHPGQGALESCTWLQCARLWHAHQPCRVQCAAPPALCAARRRCLPRRWRGCCCSAQRRLPPWPGPTAPPCAGSKVPHGGRL